MRLLLDTHAWIFSVAEPERLSATAREAILQAPKALVLSPISVWEAALLGQKGRLRLEPDPIAWVRRALQVVPAAMAPVTHEIALASRDLPDFPSQDPADRFLVATALVHDLALVTADRAIQDYPPVRTLW